MKLLIRDEENVNHLWLWMVLGALGDHHDCLERMIEALKRRNSLISETEHETLWRLKGGQEV